MQIAGQEERNFAAESAGPPPRVYFAPKRTLVRVRSKIDTQSACESEANSELSTENAPKAIDNLPIKLNGGIDDPSASILFRLSTLRSWNSHSLIAMNPMPKTYWLSRYLESKLD